MGSRVVNLHKEPYDVYIGRAGHGLNGYFGNPFMLGKDGNREEVLAQYRRYFSKRIKVDAVFAANVESLRGKTLGCFCKPLACHGDVIVEYLEGRL